MFDKKAYRKNRKAGKRGQGPKYYPAVMFYTMEAWIEEKRQRAKR